MTNKISNSRITVDPFRNASVSTIREDSWCIYADGFKRAADLLVENVKTTYDINTVIFPILFLYRQYVELSLKEIIGYGQYLSEHEEVRQGGHNLKNLWAASRSYIQKYYKEITKEDLAQAESLISELHKLDPTSEASRYPVVKQKSAGIWRTASFSYDDKLINLDKLADKMRKLACFLDKISNYLSVCEDLKREFRSNY